MPIPPSPTIERYFPVKEVSKKARREKAKGPPIFDMLFWWTRKPLIACRAAIAGAVTDLDPEEFKRVIAVDREKPYEANPQIRVEGIKLLDPFAGGGSIPFEALRMGIGATAVELLPVAYVLLKATIEYPLRYGEKLVKDVETWGMRLIQRLRGEVGDLYPKGVLTYIGTWFIKCPARGCGFWTPLINNWWLDKRKKIWMKPVIDGDSLRIEIVEGGEPPDGTVKGGTGTCIKCNNAIRKSYVKDAIKRYLHGDGSLAEPRLLVKIVRVSNSRAFRAVTSGDAELLKKARERVNDLLNSNDPDVPVEPIAEFGSTIRARAYGFEKWYQFFNPRQLLTLVTLTKLVREIGRELEREKTEEGMAPDEAREYAKAVATYLALMLCKHADYNSIVTLWHSSRTIISHTLSFRGVSMTWNFCEVNPFERTSGSLISMFNQVLRGLKFASKSLSVSNNILTIDTTLSQKEISPKVVCSSATSLPISERYDLIVTDPPYYDDVQYSELSDFFYVWLKRALGEYYPEVFHYSTQWEELSLQEVSVNPARFKVPGAKQRSKEHFRALLKMSMRECYRLLKENGLLIVFFAHSDPEAWRDLVEALQSAGFTITRTWPVHTEMIERVTATGKGVIDTSLIVVARKRVRSNGIGYVEEIKPKVRTAVRNEVRRLVQEFGLKGADLINAAMGPALRIITQYDRIERASTGNTVIDILNIVEETVVPAFLEVKLGTQLAARLDPLTSYYVYTRVSYGVRGKDRRLILPFDHANRIALALGVSLEELSKARVVKYTRSKSRRDVEVILPRGEPEAFLRERGLSLSGPAPRCVIDVVHLLEVAYDLRGRRGVEELYSRLKGFREFDVGAIRAVIQVLYTGLADDDPEKPLLKPLLNLEFKGTGYLTMDRFFG